MGTKHSGAMVIGGVEYRWNFKRGARATYDAGLTGHSLYVFVNDGVGRDLILDFPYGELGNTDATADYSAVVAALQECVPLALRAGWNPLKRGRPVRMDVTTLRGASHEPD